MERPSIEENRTIRLTRGEWLALRNWINAYGYGMRPDEALDRWQARTAPISYAYAQIVEAACHHERDDTEPYCTKCSMLMED